MFRVPAIPVPCRQGRWKFGSKIPTHVRFSAPESIISFRGRVRSGSVNTVRFVAQMRREIGVQLISDLGGAVLVDGVDVV